MINTSFNISEYENWNGDFNQLIEVVNKIFKENNCDFELTSRTARHYQQKNILGRGLKNGRSSVFNINNIKELLYAREMINEGLPIKYTASLISDCQLYMDCNNSLKNSLLTGSMNVACQNTFSDLQFFGSGAVLNNLNAVNTVSNLLSMNYQNQNYEKQNVIKNTVEKVDFSDVFSITLDKNKLNALSSKEKEIMIANIKKYLKGL